jgi:hypothetical protein
VRKPPPPGTPITLAIIEDKRSLGQATLSQVRGKIHGEPVGVTAEASQWWFMLGWVMRSMAHGPPKDDPAMVLDAFAEFTLATGESRTQGDA